MVTGFVRLNKKPSNNLFIQCNQIICRSQNNFFFGTRDTGAEIESTHCVYLITKPIQYIYIYIYIYIYMHFTVWPKDFTPSTDLHQGVMEKGSIKMGIWLTKVQIKRFHNNREEVNWNQVPAFKMSRIYITKSNSTLNSLQRHFALIQAFSFSRVCLIAACFIQILVQLVKQWGW